MTNEEITSCIQTLRFLENNFINDHGTFMNEEQPDNIEKIIKFLKEKSWIPVSERLPAEGQWVAVTWGDQVVTCLAQDNDGAVKEALTDIWLYPGPEMGDGYTAWMPRPEPYQSND